MSSVPSTSHPRSQTLFGIELFFLAAALATTAFRLYFVNVTKVFHVNVRFLLMNECFGNGVYIILKGLAVCHFLSASGFFSPEIEYIIRYVFMSFVAFPAFNNLVILAERGYGTLRAKNYESQVNYCFLVVALGIPWAFCVINTLLYLSGVQAVHSVIFFIALVSVTAIAFGILSYVNVARYNRTNEPQMLTERYQISENIKITKMMAFYIASCLLFQLVHLGLAFLAFYVFPIKTGERHLWLLGVVDVTSAFKTFVEPAILFFSCSQFYKKYKHNTSPSHAVNNVDQEGRLYFESLRKQWA